VIRGDARRCVELVAQAVAQGRDVNRLSRDLVEHFRNLLVARLASGRNDARRANESSAGFYTQLLDLPDQEIADLAAQSRPVSIETLLDYFDFMAAGDEAVTRASTPRFTLESVLIHLAGLPQTLPVAALIERLERLEGKFSSGGGKESAIGSVKEKAAPWLERQPQVLPAEKATAGPSESWREFVAVIGREKKILASHLDTARALEMPPGRLKIGVSERHHLAFLLDGDNLATLKDEAKKFFNQDVNVQIVGLPPDGLPEGPSAGAERSPMVTEALRIFGGSVRNVRRDNG
jgi:DNA polymerase III gamma/tau subunit